MTPVRGAVLAGAFAGLIPLVACSSGTVVLNQAPPKQDSDCSSKIQVFGSAQEVGRPYQSLCLVNAQVSGVAGGQGNMNIVVGKAKSRACECGADALIISKAEPITTGMGGATLTGTAIRFTDEVKE